MASMPGPGDAELYHHVGHDISDTYFFKLLKLRKKVMWMETLLVYYYRNWMLLNDYCKITTLSKTYIECETVTKLLNCLGYVFVYELKYISQYIIAIK